MVEVVGTGPEPEDETEAEERYEWSETRREDEVEPGSRREELKGIGDEEEEELGLGPGFGEKFEPLPLKPTILGGETNPESRPPDNVARLCGKKRLSDNVNSFSLLST
ncbi:hypothetical protein VKT23_004607 [Stygiomarasmius scandens]|uniref:Uncharacterized protein n=1 Tax=Marasmiellus scandens TaxID=2682957 RepID=A0ABR1K0D6_9AGAR